MVYLILGNGFEEIEGIATVDILRRSGAEVCTAGIGGRQIVGAHGIPVVADCTVDEMDQTLLEMIVLPGGMGGVEAMLGSQSTLDAIRQAYGDGKYVAAICAAPMVLSALKITDGKRATSYPGTAEKMGAAVYQEDEAVVVDGRVITSRGPGTTIPFALKLSEILRGGETAKQVASGLVIC